MLAQEFSSGMPPCVGLLQDKGDKSLAVVVRMLFSLEHTAVHTF